MKRTVKNTIIRLVSIFVDVFIILGCLNFIENLGGFTGVMGELHLATYLITLGLIVFLFVIFGLYDDKEDNRSETLVSVCLSVVITTVIILLLSLPFRFGRDFYTWFITSALVLLPLLSLWRLCISYAMVRFKDKNEILILESDKVPSRLARKIKYSCTNLNKAWYYLLNEDDPEQKEYVLNTLIPKHDIVYISENLSPELQNDIFYLCIKLNITTNLLATPSNVAIMGSRISQFSDTPVMETPSMRLNRPQKVVKRIFDIFVSVVGLILTSPIFLIVAVAIKLDSKGPVFYFQERYTIDKKKFMLCKFRTMHIDAEKFGACLAEKDDPRVTRVGKIVRKLRLDELPQFVNILLGSMSVVGPRPERPIFADEYCEKVKNYEMRYFIKAGLTGYAQIYGRYNTRASDKILMDMIYIIKYSFWLDLKLIILTIKTMFIKESTEGVDEERDIMLDSPEREAERRKNKPFYGEEGEFKYENLGDNARV